MRFNLIQKIDNDKRYYKQINKAPIIAILLFSLTGCQNNIDIVSSNFSKDFIEVNIIQTNEIKSLDRSGVEYKTDLVNSITEYDTIQKGYSNLSVDVSNNDLKDYMIVNDGMLIPLFLQYDDKWGNVIYKYSGSNSGNTIAKSGCGTTCFAMVASYFKKEFISPEIISKWSADNGGHILGGTTYSFFSDIAPKYNLECKIIASGGRGSITDKDLQEVVSELKLGHPVIASMSPGVFTKAGHYIVLRGVTKDGKILVNDPNDNFSSKNYYNKSFDLSIFKKEAKFFCSFKLEI